MSPQRAEKITFCTIAVVICIWFTLVYFSPVLSDWLVLPALVLCTALYHSLQHECIHGHPFKNQRLNDALASLPLLCLVPYARFKTTHLQHHHNPTLTDPVLDPESWYLHPEQAQAMPKWWLKALQLNNMLLVRFVTAPLIQTLRLLHNDCQLILKGDSAIAKNWGIWLLLCALLLTFAASKQALWLVLTSAYWAYGLISVRAYLEHRAWEHPDGRSVIVNSTGPLAWLFLFNNFHALHHQKPALPWLLLPKLFRQQRQTILAENDNYYYSSYWEIFKRYAIKAKEPVIHPLMGRSSSPPEQRGAWHSSP